MPIFSVVILTAAPSGQAAEAGGAYVKIDGREALLKSIELFLNRDPVKQIQLVVQPEDSEEAKRKYGAHLSFSGVKLVTGGPRWADQLKAAGAKISDDATHVVVHDGARPAVPFSDIDALFQAAETSEVAVLTSPVRAPLIQVDATGNALHHWSAEEFVQVLTPQMLSKQQFQATLMRGEPLPLSTAKLIKGSPLNERIRGAGDASQIRAMINLLPKPKLKPQNNPFEEAQW